MINQPGKVDARPISPLVMQVTWQKASGNPSGYNVICTPHSDPDHPKVYRTESPDQLFLIIRDLEPGEAYTVTVVSLFGNVENAFSPEESVTVSMRKLNEIKLYRLDTFAVSQ